jgi:hypothetical protein
MQKRQTISKIENLGRILGYLNNVMHVYQSSTIHQSAQVKYHIYVNPRHKEPWSILTILYLIFGFQPIP